MDSPMLFQFLGESIDAGLSSFVDATAGSVINSFTTLAVAFATLYYVLVGFMMITGRVEQTGSTFLISCGKFLLIAGFALNVDSYMTWVAQTLQGLETGVSSAWAGSNADYQPKSVYELIDGALGKGWGISGDLWERAGNRSWQETNMAFGDYFNAVIIALATGIIAIPAGGMIVVAKAALVIMLGIGPMFVMCLMFPATQRYFDSWLGQVMTYIFRIALMATVLSLAVVIFNNLVSAVDLESDQNTLFTSFLLIGATVVLARLLDEMNTVSGQLAGGMSLATLTFGRMVAGATSPLRVAGSAINRQSTRRDMQSGMMVTGGRLNHLAAGNTMWNPAYRQHVMQNMGKNWGPAAGGKTSQ